MDFTIITPSLNYGHFLGECLARVAEQEGLSYEHLVFHGGSTDDSAAVAARFPGASWKQERDSGMSQAINRGFDQARGEWVMWLNADDRLKPGSLAAVSEILKGSSADIVYGDFDFIEKSGAFQRHIRLPRWSPFIHVHHCCYIGSTAAFYRRSTVIEAGHRLREDFRYVMDGEFYSRLDAAGLRFQHVPLTLADFRLHGGNTSMRHLGRTKDLNKILEAERQHVESRAIRRAHGITLFHEPYLNGLIDGVLWIAARAWKLALKNV